MSLLDKIRVSISTPALEQARRDNEFLSSELAQTEDELHRKIAEVERLKELNKIMRQKNNELHERLARLKSVSADYRKKD